jgi:coniferyl-aldehyde dehydrogenase
VLPIKGYRDIEEVVEYINQRPRPLSLYYFGHDADERRRLLSGTVPGGVTLNEVLAHALIECLPFGGIGASGMGAYRGIDGFRTFSHSRGMFQAPRPSMWKLMGLLPPYGKALTRTVERELRR